MRGRGPDLIGHCSTKWGIERTLGNSVGAVLITMALSGTSFLSAPVLAYGLPQETAANRVVRMARPQSLPCPARHRTEGRAPEVWASV